VVVLSLAFLRGDGDDAGAVYGPARDARSPMRVKVSATGVVEPVVEVEVGLSDWQQVEVTEGLKEGEEVPVFLTGRALEQSREFMERRRRTAIPGLKRSTE